MKIVMAKSAADLLRDKASAIFALHPQTRETHLAMAAAREAVQILARRTHATGGLVLLDRNGNPGWAFNTPRMSYGYVQSDGTLVTAV